jgi:hypothetical protein
MLFLWRHCGTPFQFIHSQVVPGWAGSSLLRQQTTWSVAQLATPATLGWIGSHLLAATPLLLLYSARRRLPHSYLVWAGLTWLISLSSLGSLGRFAVALFPFFVAAALLPWPRRVFAAAIVTSGALQIVLTVRQVLGYWVAG